MKTNSQKATYEAQSENIAPYTPGTDCANIDPDFDDVEDDEIAELKSGLERHALAHGEKVNG